MKKTLNGWYAERKPQIIGILILVVIFSLVVLLPTLLIIGNNTECKVCGKHFSFQQFSDWRVCKSCCDSLNENLEAIKQEDSVLPSEMTYESMTTNQKLDLIDYIYSRFDYYIAIDGSYDPDKHDELVWKDALDKYPNLTYEQIDSIYFCEYDLREEANRYRN